MAYLKLFGNWANQSIPTTWSFHDFLFQKLTVIINNLNQNQIITLRLYHRYYKGHNFFSRGSNFHKCNKCNVECFQKSHVFQSLSKTLHLTMVQKKKKTWYMPVFTVNAVAVVHTLVQNCWNAAMVRQYHGLIIKLQQYVKHTNQETLDFELSMKSKLKKVKHDAKNSTRFHKKQC